MTTQSRAGSAPARGVPGAQGDEARLLGVVGGVVAELQRRHPPPPAALQSRFEEDLGLDSLSLAEVLVALEEEFAVALPSSLLSSAERPIDLLRALRAAGAGAGAPGPAVRELVGRADEASPSAAGTLVEVLEWHCATHPDAPHLRLLSEEGGEEAVSYRELAAAGRRVAAGLIAHDLAPGDTVALMLPTSRQYFEAFLGILLAGCVPVPVYPPARPSQIEEHLRRHAKVLANARARVLVTVPEAASVGRLLRSSVESLELVTTAAGLAREEEVELPRLRPGDTALVQYTSGSTGQPKGVVLSHANILANIRAMGEAAEVTPRDVFVSWLPLYHDMGLIGAWLGSLSLNMEAVVMSPLSFLARPVRWLEAISRYGGTVTAAPNFAYERCLRTVGDEELATLELSSLRLAFNGAEPVSADTMERFYERFSNAGLRQGCLAPVYGLAECAVGLTFPPPGRPLLVDLVDPDALRREGRAVPRAPGPGTRRLVACGQPLPGHEVRVVDDSGREVAEREEGAIQFRGPSATAGYLRDEAATDALYRDGWLETGDLGYVAGGDLYVTGRSKDIVIRGGRNLHPEELEAAVGEIPGVRRGCVAAFAALDPTSGSERLVVAAETHLSAVEELAALAALVRQATVEVLGTPPDDVVLARPGAVPKTSSGKIRRAAAADLYAKGALGAKPRATWWQLTRFALSGIAPRLRRRRRLLAALGYNARCWATTALVVAPTVLLLALLPRQQWRRRLVRRAAQSARRGCGLAVLLRGEENLPSESCVLVANHGSWLDAPLLVALLPARFVFVAGEVFSRQRLAGFLLRRIGTEFVERSAPGEAVAGVAHLVEVARERPLVIFPEGGLARAPGLRPFHMGAFVAASDAVCPVVPVTIRGTRSVLRPGGRFVRRGAVTVVIGTPIRASQSGWEGALELERRARAVILHHLGEPDLS